MYKNPLQSYQNQTVPAEGNPNQSEAWALTQAALKLRDAQKASDESQMKAAVRINLQLWTIFQADLLAPTCEVPLEIRNNILSLASFIDKHSIEFMSKPDPKRMDVLININREISGGLMDGAKFEAEQQNSNSADQQQTDDQPPAAPGGLQDIEA